MLGRPASFPHWKQPPRHGGVPSVDLRRLWISSHKTLALPTSVKPFTSPVLGTSTFAVREHNRIAVPAWYGMNQCGVCFLDIQIWPSARPRIDLFLGLLESRYPWAGAFSSPVCGVVQKATMVTTAEPVLSPHSGTGIPITLHPISLPQELRI